MAEGESIRPFDFAGLSNVLFESADLLEESRDSDDQRFREAALELAIRSLYTASTAIDRYVKAQQVEPGAGPGNCEVLSGPWAPEAPGAPTPEA